MPDVFLSYSRDDQAIARLFAAAFERAGLGVWWDQTLRSGENYDQVTEAALREAKAVVVLWSKKSVDSRWVRAEATTADRAGTLVPAMIEPCNRPIMFELKHTAELAHWKGEEGDPAWKAFLADVHRLVGREGVVEAIAPEANRPRSGRRLLIAIPVALLILAGSLFWGLNRVDDTTVEESSGLSRDEDDGVSLAVLPFADMSAAKDQEYFSDGLTEEILNQLALIPELRLIGRTSSFSYKGRNEDLRTIGQQLGVANLLEGSIRKDGSQLRITVQLINAKDRSRRWSQTYERELSGVFALQDEIARDVAQALSVKLDVGEFSRSRGGTTNLDAYDRYLRARQLIFQEGGRAAAEQAVPLLREAVAFDPRFARGWNLLGNALNQSVLGEPEDKARGVILESNAAFTRAQELAPEALRVFRKDMAEKRERRDWAGMEALGRKRLSEEPFTAANLERGGALREVLWVTGQAPEAIQHYRRLLQIEPLSLPLSAELLYLLYASGLPEQAQAEYERTLPLPGNHQRAHYIRLLWLIAQPDPDPAAVAEQFRRMLGEPNLPMPLLAKLSQVGTDKAAARAAIRKEFEGTDMQDTAKQVTAMLADAYGDRDLALTVLQELAPTGEGTYVLWLLPYSGVRADPRFKDIVRNLGLVDYWRSTGKWGAFCRPMGDVDFECR
jgi:TolB-like protein